MAGAVITVKTKGFKEALDNLEKLPEIIAAKIVKNAAREGGTVLLKAVRESIYGGLQKRSGLLAAGLSVNVGVNRGKVRVTAYIKEREIKTAGPTKSSAIARSAAWRARKRTSARIAPKFGAYYWRFLELGVSERRTSSGANRGALPATGNVQGAFKTSAGSAIEAFRRVLIADTETEVTKLSKG